MFRRLLFLLLLCVAAPLRADGPWQPMEPIYATAVKRVKQNVGQKLINPKIYVHKLGRRTRLPRCTTPLEYALLQGRRQPFGRMTVQVSCPNPRWKLFLTVTVSGQTPVVVSTRLIPRHTLISANALRRQLVDASRRPHGALSRIEDAAGMRAARAIPPETVITARMLLPPYWVFERKPVTLLTRIGALEVRTRGIALKNGVEGAQVPVRNARSGKVVRGVVIAPNTVLVP